MKIIFLDIDGVLNAVFTQEKIDGYKFVTDCKIELLRELVERTKAKIVLSSDWRMGWLDLDMGLNTIHAKHFVALRDKLQEFGLELIGRTPVKTASERGEEIDLWLQTWQGEPVESFVVLDDLGGAYMRPHAGRLVQTSMTTGLLPKHIAKAEKILEKPYIREGGAINEKERVHLAGLDAGPETDSHWTG